MPKSSSASNGHGPVEIKGQRNSNLEMLRIVSMLMIIIFHLLIHAGIADPKEPTLNTLVSTVGCTFGLAAVVAFTMITGYFMVTQKITVTKILRLLVEVWFYSIAIGVLALILLGSPIDETWIKATFFPIFTDQYWFISAYVMLVILSPFINKCLNSITAKQHLLLVLVLLVISFGLFSIHTTFVMSKHLTLIVVYIIAAFIRLHPQEVFLNLRNSLMVLAYAIGSILLLSVLVNYLIYDKSLGWGPAAQIVAGMILVAAIAFCLRADKDRMFSRLFATVVALMPLPMFLDLGYLTRSEVMFNYIGVMSGLTLLLGMALFLVFLNMKPRTNRVVNWIAASTFAVYLIHENPQFFRVIWSDWLGVPAYSDSYLFLPYVLFCAVSMFAIAIVLDKVRVYLIFKPLSRWTSRFYEWVEESVRKLSDRADEALK